MLAHLLELQRQLYAALGARIQGMDGGADAVLAAGSFALFLGMVHALTPGHGKAVVFTYFLGARGGWRGGLAMAAKIAALHVGSAIVLVAAFGSAASMFGRPSGVARGVQIASYALVLLVGLWLSYRAVREAWGPERGAGPHAHRAARGLLPLAVGLLPCPMTMLILTFALVHASLGAGLLLAVLLGIGIAATIGAVGAIGILLRRGIFLRLDRRGRAYATALSVLQIASALTIALLGAVFLLGSLDGPKAGF